MLKYIIHIQIKYVVDILYYINTILFYFILSRTLPKARHHFYINRVTSVDVHVFVLRRTCQQHLSAFVVITS